MYLCVLALLVSVLHASAFGPLRVASRLPVSRFVSIDKGTNFVVNGRKMNFIGTNAYWLSTLNSEADIDSVLANMSAAGVTVVRTWAFNDVDVIPESGTWFQLIANGTTFINTGPNGLQKLDTVVRLAEKHQIFVVLSLTNNWNVRTLLNNSPNGVSMQKRQGMSGTSHTTHPRNTLSNDYGGMDAYVREFGTSSQHDEFYTNPTIMSHFLNYTSFIVSRYRNNSAIFSWEIANDPRCGSSLPASPSCNTNTVTKFHVKVSTHIKTVDSNHLVSSGNQGFICTNCTKIIPPPPPNSSPIPLPHFPIPPSQPDSSSLPGSTSQPTSTAQPDSTSQSANSTSQPISTSQPDSTSQSNSTSQPTSTSQPDSNSQSNSTSPSDSPTPPSPAQPSSSPNILPPGSRSFAKAKQLMKKLMAERKSILMKVKKHQAKTRDTSGFIRIRGKWMAPPTSRRRQNANPDQDFGSAFDGSQGVDSQDILNIPDISFGTFQLFPDQNSYGIDDPTLPAFNNTVNQGLAWIKQHAMAGMMVNKPVTLNGFGLVSQSNAASFVPFNSTESPVISIFGNSTTGPNLTSFFTDEQRNEAYATWLRAGLEVGLQGMFQYQWSQGNLTAMSGTSISPDTDPTGNIIGTGVSPNDGYGQTVGDLGVQAVISQASQEASTQP